MSLSLAHLSKLCLTETWCIKQVAIWQLLHPCFHQWNVAEAEEPRGHTTLKKSTLDWSTDSGFHTKVHESLGVFALFFALLSLNACQFYFMVKKKLIKKTENSVNFVLCLSLELLYLFNQQTKKKDALRIQCQCVVLRKVTVEIELIHEWTSLCLLGS